MTQYLCHHLGADVMLVPAEEIVEELLLLLDQHLPELLLQVWRQSLIKFIIEYFGVVKVKRDGKYLV